MSDGSTQSTHALIDHLDAIEALIRANEEERQHFLSGSEAEHARLSSDLRVTQRALKLRLGARLGPDEEPPLPPKVVFPPAPIPVAKNYRTRSAPIALPDVGSQITHLGGFRSRCGTSGISAARVRDLTDLLRSAGEATVSELAKAAGYAESSVGLFVQIGLANGSIHKIGTRPRPDGRNGLLAAIYSLKKLDTGIINLT